MIDTEMGWKVIKIKYRRISKNSKKVLKAPEDLTNFGLLEGRVLGKEALR